MCGVASFDYNISYNNNIYYCSRLIKEERLEQYLNDLYPSEVEEYIDSIKVKHELSESDINMDLYKKILEYYEITEIDLLNNINIVKQKLEQEFNRKLNSCGISEIDFSDDNLLEQRLEQKIQEFIVLKKKNEDIEKKRQEEEERELKEKAQEPINNKNLKITFKLYRKKLGTKVLKIKNDIRHSTVVGLLPAIVVTGGILTIALSMPIMNAVAILRDNNQRKVLEDDSYKCGIEEEHKHKCTWTKSVMGENG